ncbi:MAG TPA: peptide chain release factor N(5)-glutamine methyltransferase [Spirochaetota bacterium]|mgnify:CR=1 FL=1|nr:peptide chain release factor N(5)-glutamine methyltransferase [Spirochaetota bacterium]HOL56589.1 peptide chain release factor N(5)-glutamine methyltransferase [Spirochaetota bacterium]HPP04008.1 peptide chain release factor N(5)-glutamine methyltransferase [Spirochaetota bacterium]
MTIKEVFNQTKKSLEEKNFILSPDKEASLIIRDVLNLSLKDFLLLQDEYIIKKKEIDKIKIIVKKRLKGDSLASILNKKEFFDLEFFVNKNVLIPRPETELLIEIFLQKMDKASSFKILDIGTGSGILSIVLSNYYKESTFIAIDKSKKALRVAKINIKRLCKNNNIILLHKDFFKYKPDFKFDIIISNPPYIPSDDTKNLLKSKTISDPEMSLNGGKDGLNFYRHLYNFATLYLKNNGSILIEHGYRQQDKIVEIFKNDYNIERFKDFADNPRALYMLKR